MNWIVSRKSKSDLFLLKSNEFSFISHDSILKLNDMRTVSVNRILYQQSGRIDPSSDTYKEIETLTLRKYFPSFFHDYEQSIKTIESLNAQIKALKVRVLKSTQLKLMGAFTK